MDQATQAATLSEYNFIVLVDASASMSTPDCGGRTRWAYMQESLAAFACDLGKLDSDGIDVILFSGAHGVKTFPNALPDVVSSLFGTYQPRGSTPLDAALKAAVTLKNKSNKKAFILVATDGAPDDEMTVERIIRDQANSQSEDDECTFCFLQVGHDAHATKYLTHLDDDLKGAKFDIVDAMTIEEAEKFATITDMVVKAIND